MIEKVIFLDRIDPVNLYGINNSKIEKIKIYFPKLKIIARGNEIKVSGDAIEVTNFEERMELIIKHYIKFNSLSEADIERLIQDDIAKILEHQDRNDEALLYSYSGKPVKPRTEHQKEMVERYKDNDLIFAIGPAGTGKTYVAIALAVRALKNKEIRRIILSRPAVEAGERLGFLPGDLKEKLDPYLQALYDALNDMIPAKKLEEMMVDGIVQIAPLAFMRGRTLSNCVVILDEAQNASINQLKMFLTRMGENSKFIVTGDITQIDLPQKSESGLLQANRILQGIDGLAFIQFDKQDIVRHKLVRHIVEAYDKEKERTTFDFPKKGDSSIVSE